MYIKWTGAILIIAASLFTGLCFCRNYTKQEQQLDQLLRALRYMQCELQYRLTSLPAQFEKCTTLTENGVKVFFLQLCRELDNQVNPNAEYCLLAAMDKVPELAPVVRDILRRFGQTLGHFDADGQANGIAQACKLCEEHLQKVRTERPVKLRNYQTLSLCAGAALVILFL